MRRFKKILKWTGITILSLVLVFVILVFALQNKKFDAPYPNLHATKDSAMIERGKYLAYGPAHCSGCHTPVADEQKVINGEEVAFKGGRPFVLPIGTLHSLNITPDDETGIGKVPDSVLARSLRYGVARDGRALFDFMPFHNLSDEDLVAVLSFLRAQPAVKNEVPATKLTFIGKAVKAFLIKPVGPDGEVSKSVKEDTTAEYGKYLATYVTNCRGCHTSRSLMTGAYTGPMFAGGLKLEASDGSYCVTPNLTPDKETGVISRWTEGQFIARFRAPRAIKTSDMPWDQFRKMSDTDLKAIYRYLVSLDPIKNSTGPTYVAGKTTGSK
jgi:mono/diheme cytochrome c family protein